MSTVVFINAPAYGHVNPTLPLVAELVRCGERVFYYTTEPFQQAVDQTGATFRSYGKEFPDHFARGIEDNPFLENPFVMIEANIETGKWVLDHLLDEIRDLQPDYLIHDAFCFWGRCIAQALPQSPRSRSIEKSPLVGLPSSSSCSECSGRDRKISSTAVSW